MHNHWRIGLATLSLLAVAATPLTSHAGTPSSRPGVTQRVSVASGGAQGDAASGAPVVADNVDVSMTPDGRYVAFDSTATNLVPGDTNGSADVFVRDRSTGRTDRVSVASGGAQGSSVAPLACEGAWGPSISANGRYVAFVSCFPNLVPNTVYLYEQVFVHDRVSGVTTLVSVDKDGHPALPGGQYSASISGDGHLVAFTSNSSNLTGLCALPLGLLCGSWQVVVRDLVHRTTQLASVAADGTPANDLAEYPSISGNGRYVVFASFADNLAPAGQNGPCLSRPTNSVGKRACGKVFRRDLKTKRTEVVSLGLRGESPDNGAAIDSPFAGPSISADGRYVLYNAEATNLVPTPPSSGLYVRDMVTGRTQNVAVDSSGHNRVGGGTGTISPDGRYVVYGDTSTGGCPLGQATCDIPCTGHAAAAGTTPNAVEYVLYDRVTGSHEEFCDPGQQSRQAGGVMAVVSSGGRYIAFASTANDLVGADTNKASDVFVRDRGRVVGAGGLARTGRLTVAGARGFATTGVLRPAVDNSARGLTGDRIVDATVSYRPGLADLFVRIAVSQLPVGPVGGLGVVYGLRLDARHATYEVRASGALADASFRLWRRTGAGWVRVADLAGGYGTTGQEVVVAVPLATLDLRTGGQLSNLRAFASR